MALVPLSCCTAQGRLDIAFVGINIVLLKVALVVSSAIFKQIIGRVITSINSAPSNSKPKVTLVVVRSS